MLCLGEGCYTRSHPTRSKCESPSSLNKSLGVLNSRISLLIAVTRKIIESVGIKQRTDDRTDDRDG
jgi:hypothetical protein